MNDQNPPLFKSLPFLGLLTGVIALLGVIGLGSLFGMALAVKAWHGAWVVLLSLALGSLFLVLLHSLTASRWGSSFLRIPESFASLFPLLIALLLPALVGFPFIYSWAAHGEGAAVGHHAAHQRLSWMNPAFFIVRSLVLLGAFAWLAFFFTRRDGTHALVRRGVGVSAGGMIFFLFAGSLLAFDFVMMLSPVTSSTIFGIQFLTLSGAFAAAVWSASASLLATRPEVAGAHGADFRHDLAKLTYVLVLFNCFVTFVQYYVVWFGNLPEETVFYAIRRRGGWDVWAMLVIFSQLAVPAFAWMRADAKRHPFIHRVVSIWIAIACLLHLVWLVWPEFRVTAGLSAIDLLALLSAFGFLLAGAAWVLRRRPVVIPTETRHV